MKIITLLLAACALGSIAHAQESARVQGFSVVLLLGEQAGSIPTQGLSASAQRAIADIKEFLPYKGYRVLDTQWVAGSEFGQSKGRIRGIDKQDFEFQLDTQPTELGKSLMPLGSVAVMPPAPDRGTPASRNAASTRARFQLVIPGSGTVRQQAKGSATRRCSTIRLRLSPVKPWSSERRVCRVTMR